MTRKELDKLASWALSETAQAIFLANKQDVDVSQYSSQFMALEAIHSMCVRELARIPHPDEIEDETTDPIAKAITLLQTVVVKDPSHTFTLAPIIKRLQSFNSQGGGA